MQATIEISMYPLHQDYENRVLAFLDQLHSHPDITIETNGLSTQLFGEYHTLMQLLEHELKAVLEAQDAIFVLKLGKGTLRYKG